LEPCDERKESQIMELARVGSINITSYIMNADVAEPAITSTLGLLPLYPGTTLGIKRTGDMRKELT
jgi:hypothetical protein